VGFTCQAPSGSDFGVRKYDSRQWLVQADQRLLEVSELALSGAHNVSNALAALAMASVVGLQPAAMIEGLRQFRGLPHRCQPVASCAGVLYIDDSKATNVAASVAAIRGHQGPLVLIAGGLGKDQEFAPMQAALSGRTRAVVLMGEDGPSIERALGGSVPTHPATSLREAVALAAGLAEPGDTVLLSPACASFDMFESFEDRGRQFAAAVRGLADGD
jgi:UDP-N-acetylmuramoylalanine--D-glutamate ligase